MPELQRLRADHAAAVLAFELANRGYFAASISDRGDEFFDQFAERHSASQKVLTKAGFVPAGPADPADLGGKPGSWYQRHLAAG